MHDTVKQDYLAQAERHLAIALVDVPDERRQWMLRALAEVGANAIQIEDAKHAANARDTFNVFARV